MRLNLRSLGEALVDAAVSRPRTIVLGSVLVTVALAALIINVKVDTDPENMLPADDPVRVLNREMREDFGTREMIVLGIVDDAGVLNPQTMTRAAGVIDRIVQLDGVVAEGVVSFKSAGGDSSGALSQDDVDGIAEEVSANPLLAGRVVSPDGRGLAVYIPLISKSDANGVASSTRAIIRESGFGPGVETYLAGLPLAEEEFGRDMFIQMGILAPLAGMFIFALMLYFFRRLSLVIPAMIVAMLSVIWTMGLLIGTGFTLHIMSSMIPIFLMPIAILDSIHVLSEFFDRYPALRDRRATLRAVYRELTLPLTFTSITTAVAFGSLALAPIPPVRVFGLFVAFGVFAAWLLTMLFIPAFVMLLSEDRLQRSLSGNIEGSDRLLAGGLRRLGRLATARSYAILPVFLLLALAATPGVMRLSVNDNPVNWFKAGSEIRRSTEELGERFPGTYNASLLLEAEAPGALTSPEMANSIAGLQVFWEGMDVVGLTASYADVISVDGSLPADRAGIEEALATAAASNNGQGLRSLITPDLQKANLQVLMKEGDNKSMARVVDETEAYFAAHPLPDGVRVAWAGETYLNLAWQDKMVSGMLKAFLSTFAVVLLLMVVLFRSVRWALLAIVPMTATILFVYGVVGYTGKAYDMPMAVVSTLVLGIGVDFAIHLVARYRELAAREESTGAALERFFEEPARALTRNAFIISLGFAPLFFASLVPYIIVGAMLTSIMLLSWLTTLVVLPAVITLLRRGKQPARESGLTANVGFSVPEGEG